MKKLIDASKKDQIKGDNRFRRLGFEGENSCLGWVSPPDWNQIRELSDGFLNLDIVKDKTYFVFSGMGGSINCIKGLREIFRGSTNAQIYTIDSLDPTALSKLLGSIQPLKTLFIGISKSGSTIETHLIMNTIRKFLESHGLNYREHFLWLTDIPEGGERITKMGWEGVTSLPIQCNGEHDIGGRFSAPHTRIFLLPLLLLLNRDTKRLESIWREYVNETTREQGNVPEKSEAAIKLGAQRFAVGIDPELVEALETWVTQLIQESLGSKIEGFNPKTMVTSSPPPEGFLEVAFDTKTPDIVASTMATMYLLQVYVSFIAYHKRLNFVDQLLVENYKKAMINTRTVCGDFIEKSQIKELNGRVLKYKQINEKRFIEAVCYWDLSKEERQHIRKTIQDDLPTKIVTVFTGSDWNHHSYQAAYSDEDTLYIILTKSLQSPTIEGIPKELIRNNIDVLQKIALATYETIKEKALLLRLDTN